MDNGIHGWCAYEAFQMPIDVEHISCERKMGRRLIHSSMQLLQILLVRAARTPMPVISTSSSIEK